MPRGRQADPDIVKRVFSLKQQGHGIRKIAKDFGKHRTWVSWLSLLNANWASQCFWLNCWKHLRRIDHIWVDCKVTWLQHNWKFVGYMKSHINHKGRAMRTTLDNLKAMRTTLIKPDNPNCSIKAMRTTLINSRQPLRYANNPNPRNHRSCQAEAFD